MRPTQLQLRGLSISSRQFNAGITASWKEFCEEGCDAQAVKNSKYVIPDPVRFLNGVRNLLFPRLFCEKQIPHPQTTRVRDDKCASVRRLFRRAATAAEPAITDAEPARL